MTPAQEKAEDRAQARKDALMPGGVPRYVRCYDNGGESADRYTVAYTRRSNKIDERGYDRTYDFRAMSEHPFHPQGVGMWGETRHYPVDAPRGAWPTKVGGSCHLGTRIPFTDLPEDCQRLVVSDYMDLWNLK